jgi:tetratricopeptide (TPR) repeat protein
MDRNNKRNPMLHYIILALFITGSSLSATAQEERGLTREGNKYFDKEKYSDAEASYKKALEKKNNFPEAIFNLGDAMYKQGRYDDAAKQFELAAKMLTDTLLKAQSYHNLGNCSMEKKEYEEAIKAYKQALKLNPRDKDTKYNLAYANAKLRDKQQNKQQNKQDNKDQKNQDKDKKGDQKDQDKKNQDNKGQKDKDSKGDNPDKKAGGKMSKEQAEKLLQALKAEEQKTQEKMQKKMSKPQEVKIEKDW